MKRSDKSGNVDDDNTSEDSYEETPGDISLYKENYIWFNQIRQIKFIIN